MTLSQQWFIRYSSESTKSNSKNVNKKTVLERKSRKWKIEPTQQERIFSNHKYNKGLWSRLYKDDLYNSTNNLIWELENRSGIWFQLSHRPFSIVQCKPGVSPALLRWNTHPQNSVPKEHCRLKTLKLTNTQLSKSNQQVPNLLVIWSCNCSTYEE